MAEKIAADLKAQDQQRLKEIQEAEEATRRYFQHEREAERKRESEIERERERHRERVRERGEREKYILYIAYTMNVPKNKFRVEHFLPTLRFRFLCLPK